MEEEVETGRVGGGRLFHRGEGIEEVVGSDALSRVFLTHRYSCIAKSLLVHFPASRPKRRHDENLAKKREGRREEKKEGGREEERRT